jgi:hypothetical protein
MSSLKRGSRVVVDTHVWVEAAQAIRAGREDSNDRRLIEAIIDVCPIVLLSPGQSREMRPHLRRAGFRFPGQQDPVSRRLDEENKLRRPNASKLKALSDKQRKAFRGSNRDDPHLYVTAIAGDRIVITRDSNLLDARESLKKATSVRTLDISEALEELSPPAI